MKVFTLPKTERISSLEVRYVIEVLNSQFSSGSGATFMNRLETEFSKKHNDYNAISFSNGTCTMHAALEAAGVSEGDEVIVPPLTMASTAFAVLQCNATPIFADIDPATFQIDPSDIVKKITPNTKAIITVALYGGAPRLDKILTICKANNLFLLEDNAECFGAYFKDIPVGCYGDASSFSFQSSKHLTAGEGGILLVKSEAIADRVRQFQSLGYAGVSSDRAKIDKNTIQSPEYKRHLSLGFNYRMPELCAAVALAQTERIENLIEPRLKAAAAYKEIADNYKSILTQQNIYEGSTHTYWTWACKLADGIVWDDFKSLFVKNGGKSFYGAWALTYNEPFIRNKTLFGREKYLTSNGVKNWEEPNCPNADKIQPLLCQFQTNFFDQSALDQQCNALNLTLAEFYG